MQINMICGCQASGKSSISKELLKTLNNPVYLNRDSLNCKIIDLIPMMEDALSNNRDVLLDNTMITISSRKPFIDISKKYNTPIHCHYVDISIEDAQINVVKRAIEITGKFPTPTEIEKLKHPNIFPPLVLFKFRKEFEEPSINEGFDTVNKIPFIRRDEPCFNNKALILDYDGCLRECINGNGKYPVNIDQIQINYKCIDKLNQYKDNGYILLGISNQSGISKGELTEEKAKELFEYTNNKLGFNIDYRFCPHRSAPISCYCRKPQTGLFVEFMYKYKLDRKQCIFVGDMKTDETFANRAGIKFIHANNFYV